MPYIKKQKRAEIWQEIPTTSKRVSMLSSYNVENAGDLNYAITMLINDYIKRKELNYQNINDVVGALEGAKLEFYRRTVVPYEDKKIQENGDV